MRNRRTAANGMVPFELAFTNACFDTVTDLENLARVSLFSIICREEHNRFVDKIMYSAVLKNYETIHFYRV